MAVRLSTGRAHRRLDNPRLGPSEYVLLFLVVLYYTLGRGPDLFETCQSILKAIGGYYMYYFPGIHMQFSFFWDNPI